MGYLIIGLIWCGWLEWYTSRVFNSKWVWRERLFHTLLWPVSLSVFIKNL
jgi:hypothetical protein